MSDPRAGKTFKVTWEDWCEVCAYEGLDPWDEWENGGGEMSFSLGGGDSYSVQLIGDPPEKEELHD